METVAYGISKENEFVIENYNCSPTFASFFPGIAGTWGVPMWAFYTNRDQCMTSFGILDKDGAIMEFQPANKAYRYVVQSGFRTFIKAEGKVYEPFRECSGYKPIMKIRPENLVITETNNKEKFETTVKYFTLAGEKFPALVKITKIKNLSSKARTIEVLDGMPSVVPAGFADALMKNMSTTIEAWSIVENLDKNAPFYKLKVSPADVSETTFLKEGNFLVSFAVARGKESETQKLVNPNDIFGEAVGLSNPEKFAEKTFKIPSKQVVEGYIPAAFSYKKVTLKKNEEVDIISIIGRIDTVEELNREKNRMSKASFIKRKDKENTECINHITDHSNTQSASKAFDLYTAQTFLDNVMRGGLPITFGNKVFYSFYRKHGDMERDYNDFKVVPTYLSQGNGNYRDINQNRRNDIFFNPRVMDSNILRFYELIQLDGFNPLVVLPEKYVIRSKEKAAELLVKHVKGDHTDLIAALTSPFMVGSLIKGMENEGDRLIHSRDHFLTDILSSSNEVAEAVHGEGYWADHFTYNTDLLESFEAVFPDKIKELLFKEGTLNFRDSDHIVLPRSEKYQLVNGKVRQYRSVRTDHDKKVMMDARKHDKFLVHTEFGKGKVYKTSLMAKITSIVVNKISSLDPDGMGIEMEADKPDWYDALNGLPGLIGSSLSETLELKRLCIFAANHVTDNDNLKVPQEIKTFIDTLAPLFHETNTLSYWDKATSAREEFRAKTKLGISGNEEAISGHELKKFFFKAAAKCELGIKRCLEKYGTYVTYFSHEAVEFVNSAGLITVKKFEQHALPLFLEGFVHALKVQGDKNVPSMVKASGIYDKKLKMYKVNSSLASESLEIGRCRVFAPGWLENESIFLHMEYKYMLELIRAGLYDEFFMNMKNVLVPFMDPKVYKRSIFENSSFIASSANPDPAKHGRGYVARLSGGAAEFLDMWIRMTTGKNIFFIDNCGKLNFKLSPILPAWLFDKGKFKFKLFGNIDVEYINLAKKDTFGKDPAKVISYKLTVDKKEISIVSAQIPEPYASKVRTGQVKNIIVSLA